MLTRRYLYKLHDSFWTCKTQTLWTFLSKPKHNKTNFSTSPGLITTLPCMHTCTHIHTHTHTQKFKQCTDFQKLWLFRFPALFYIHQAEIWLIDMKTDTKPFFFFVHCSSVQQWKSVPWANYQGSIQMISSPATVCITVVLFSDCSADSWCPYSPLWGKLAF